MYDVHSYSTEVNVETKSQPREPGADLHLAGGTERLGGPSLWLIGTRARAGYAGLERLGYIGQLGWTTSGIVKGQTFPLANTLSCYPPAPSSSPN